MLRGGAALLGGLSVPAFARPVAAQAAPRLRGGEILPTPDFTLPPRYVACARPHREGGVRLEQRDLQTSSGRKFLIHNYGHGGGGITLSFGCASVVADKVAAIQLQMRGTNVMPAVAVLGCGVIGLTVADELRRRWPNLRIRIYAPHKETDLAGLTSFKAGGQFEPSGVFREYLDAHEHPLPTLPTLHDYLRRSNARIAALASGGNRQAYGIARRKNYTLREGSDGFDKGVPFDIVPRPLEGRLPFADLNEVGKEYTTWLVNPTILLPRLVADLKARGVAFRQRTFTPNEDWGAMQENILINCTGLGARELFGGDDNVKPIRGQLVILPNPRKLTYFFSGGCGDRVAYMFCRQNDIVVGGTWEVDTEQDDDGECKPSDHAICDRFLRRVRTIFEGDTASCHPIVS
jgi:glycine/D-amino acid oxidase-like deaminating enzyme